MSTSYANRKKQQSTEDLSNLMPQNIDAEEAILGAILVSPTCMNKVVEHLRPESFYKPAHRYVYEAMLQLYNGEDKIDIVSVSEHFLEYICSFERGLSYSKKGWVRLMNILYEVYPKKMEEYF